MQTMTAMESWAYQALPLPAALADSELVLNDAGRAGWELVSVIPTSGATAGLLAFMKRRRPLQEPESEDADQSVNAPDGYGATAPLADGAVTFRLILTAIDGDRTVVIVELAKACPWLHLRDAKRLVENMPTVLASGMSAEESEALQLQLFAIGAQTTAEAE